jgi:hypothetical protein
MVSLLLSLQSITILQRLLSKSYSMPLFRFYHYLEVQINLHVVVCPLFNLLALESMEHGRTKISCEDSLLFFNILSVFLLKIFCIYFQWPFTSGTAGGSNKSSC